MAPLVGEEVIHDLPDPGLLDSLPDGLEAGDHTLLDPDVLADVPVEPHSGTHVHVEDDGSGPCLEVEEGLAEGSVLPAVVEDGLQEGGDEAVARIIHGPENL